MTLSAEEQQRWDAIVDFLSEQKAKIAAVAVMVVAVLVMWVGYDTVRASRIKASSAHLTELQAAMERDDGQAVGEAFSRLLEVGDPNYVENAGLMVAAYRFGSGDKEGAIGAYRSILRVSDDPGILGIANLRLGQVLIDVGRPTEALDLAVTQAFPPGSTMSILFEELAGDALVALGNYEAAVPRYVSVLEQLLPQHGPEYERLVVSKLGLISRPGFTLDGAGEGAEEDA